MGKKERRKKGRKKKETTSTSFLSRLSGRTVCILSRAAPREFNSIFNLPKPLYANSATDVEYFWTFSILFCVPSVRRRYVPPLFVLLHGTVSFHSSSSSERRHTFPPLLAFFTNVALRIFGRVLNKAEKEREGERAMAEQIAESLGFNRLLCRDAFGNPHFERPLKLEFYPTADFHLLYYEMSRVN